MVNLKKLRSAAPMLLAGLMGIILFQACDQTSEITPPRERSYLSVIHAFDEIQSIDIDLESFSEKKTVASAVQFNSSWPQDGYASLLSEAGSGVQDTGVIIILKDWRSKEQISPKRTLSLYPGGRTTVGIIDSFGKADLVQIQDDFETPESGKANLRFMNLCHLYPAVDMISADDSIRIEKINYLLASKFTQYPSGKTTIYLKHSFTGEKIDSIPDLDLRSRKTYNIYLTQDGELPKFGVIELE